MIARSRWGAAPPKGDFDMRFRLTAAVAVTVVASLVGATPAAADLSTRKEARAALLSARDLGDGWARYDDGDDGDPEVTGCPAGDYDSVGLRFSVERGFRYGQELAFVDESIQEFRTRRAARRDFAKGLRVLDECRSITIDGQTFRLAELAVRPFADQVVLFRMSGSVASPAGEVPVVSWVYVTRWGRHEVVTTMTAAGALTAEEQRVFRQATVRVGKVATTKMADRLGR